MLFYFQPVTVHPSVCPFVSYDPVPFFHIRHETASQDSLSFLYKGSIPPDQYSPNAILDRQQGGVSFFYTDGDRLRNKTDSFFYNGLINSLSSKQKCSIFSFAYDFGKNGIFYKLSTDYETDSENLFSIAEETIMTYTGQRTREMVHHYDKSRQFGAHRDDEKIRKLLA